MKFAYYERLSAKDRRTYRKSDAAPVLELRPREDEPLPRLAAELSEALSTNKSRVVSTAAARLVHATCRAMGAPDDVKVIVRAQRPRSAEGELHGLYTRWEDGRCRIEVWMRTAAHANVVKPKTFLRTLLHEVCHHADYTVLALEDSFHTEGFFRRESSLVRHVLGIPPPTAAPEKISEKTPPKRARSRRKQLELF